MVRPFLRLLYIRLGSVRVRLLEDFYEEVLDGFVGQEFIRRDQVVERGLPDIGRNLVEGGELLAEDQKPGLRALLTGPSLETVLHCLSQLWVDDPPCALPWRAAELLLDAFAGLGVVLHLDERWERRDSGASAEHLAEDSSGRRELVELLFETLCVFRPSLQSCELQLQLNLLGVGRQSKFPLVYLFFCAPYF